ncbi:NADPH oxidase family protein [Motiliproteus sp. MSK22-1]|uniref:NADPH oxidase family protein n=1 Tax=Motiliproteus sp. MSK22-1 TaxID=1897630 RepID=UPI0013013F84|nr:NADPH oxidase family protein [Motiliproteus sp. MSK22-1]
MNNRSNTQSRDGSSLLSTTGLWLSGRRLWFKNLPWLLLIMGLAVYQFWVGFNYESNDTTNFYLRLSRAGSYVLLLILVVLWLPVMRNSLSILRRSWIGEWLPIENANALHRWLGHICIVFTLLHGSQYLLYLGTLSEPFTKLLFAEEPDLVRSMRTTMYEFVSEDESIDVVAHWIANGRTEQGYQDLVRPILKEDCTKCHSTNSTQTYAIPEMPLTRYQHALSLSDEGILSRQFRINISGLVMAGLFLIVWVSSLAWMRNRFHHHFQQLHLLGYLLALLALLHIPSIEWIVAPVVVLLVEFYLSKRSRTYRSQPASLSAISDDLMRLDIKRPLPMTIRAGHFVDLRIPGLFAAKESGKSSTVLCREWHPFSLTGSRNNPDQLVLKIRAQGDWTNALRNKLKGRQKCLLDIDVRGPYASPITHATRRKDWLMVAGGIGITPFLSLLRELKRQPSQPFHLHLVWVLREPALMLWIRPLLEKLCEQENLRCSWHFYFTGEEKLAPSEQAKLQAIGDLHLHQGRPDWPQLITAIAASGIRPNCYVCGPEALAGQVKKACRKEGWIVHKEEF